MKVLIAILLFMSTLAYAGGVFIEHSKAKTGAVLMRLVNQTPVTMYCYISYNDGYGFIDFYLNANSVSRWYYEPQGYYEWRCQ